METKYTAYFTNNISVQKTREIVWQLEREIKSGKVIFCNMKEITARLCVDEDDTAEQERIILQKKEEKC